MIHPKTTLKWINDEIGYGVFATEFIPKGSIVYTKDPFEILLSPEMYTNLEVPFREMADKYSYIDENGVRIISWDIARYVNHRCDCNTMSTGYGFEIAIKDIQEGDEITDEYGMFNLDIEMSVSCGCYNCRGTITGEDIFLYHKEWDEKVSDALMSFTAVEQPLLKYVDAETYGELMKYINGKAEYKSVLTLKHELSLTNHQKSF